VYFAETGEPYAGYDSGCLLHLRGCCYVSGISLNLCFIYVKYHIIMYVILGSSCFACLAPEQCGKVAGLVLLTE